MSYFKTIQTTGNGSEFSKTAESHNQKLNNYLKTGYALDDKAYAALGEQQKAGVKEREVESQSTSTMTHNNFIVITTTLYCEDEKEVK